MAPGVTRLETLRTIQAALHDHGLPGGVGLREADRTFVVALVREDIKAAPAVVEVLGELGYAVTVDGGFPWFVRGSLDRPPVRVSSADSCSASEVAAEPGPGKLCAGPCGRFLPLGDFPWASRERGKRFAYCRSCNAARVARSREAAKAVL